MARDASENLQFPPEALYRLGLTQQPFTDPPPSTYEDLTRATQLNVTLSLLQSGERIVLVRGSAGLGKSTFLRRLAERQPPGLQIARLTGGPQISAAALWRTLAAAAEGGDPSAAPENRDHAANHVRGARRGGLRPALLIDDADRLAPAVAGELLDLWRELDELEEGFALALAVDPERPPPWGPGQPASLPEERVHTTNLHPLTEEQTGEYLEHRLTAAGAEPGLLTAAEKSAIHEAAGGHPERIHAEAHKALADRLGSTSPGRTGRKRGRRRPALAGRGRKAALWGGAAAAVALSGAAAWALAGVLGPLLSSDSDRLEVSSNPEPQQAEAGSTEAQQGSSAEDESAADEETPYGLDLPGRYSFEPLDEAEEAASEERSLELLNPESGRPETPAPEEGDDDEAEGGEEAAAEEEEAQPAETNEGEDNGDEGNEDNEDKDSGDEDQARSEDEGEGGDKDEPSEARRWLDDRPADHYTIQLLAATQRDTVLRFAQEHGPAEAARLLETERKGESWYVLLHGDHASAEEAHAAIDELPAAAREHGPWVRTFESVRDDLPE